MPLRQATAPSHRAARSRRRRILTIALAVLLALALVAGVIVWRFLGNITTADLEGQSGESLESTGPVNILLLGSDSRDLSSDEYGAPGDGARSDSMLLVHVAEDNDRIDAVQIPRDTLMELPPCADTGLGSFGGGPGMINSAFEYGPSCSVKAAEELSGLEISHFVVVDFDGFADMVDALGGVPVCLEEPLQDTDAKLDLPAGDQTLDGKDALALARTRKAIGDGSDIGRLGHQQKVMSAIVSRAMSAGVLVRPDRLVRFLDAVTKSITVDAGLNSVGELTTLARRGAKVPDTAITFLTMPWEQAPSDPNRVVAAPDAARVFAALGADTPITLADDSDEDDSGSSGGGDAGEDVDVQAVPLAVLNGTTTPDLATTTATSLSDEGYTVQTIGNTPAPADTTRVVVPLEATPEQQAAADAVAEALGLVVEEAAEAQVVSVYIGSDVTEAPVVDLAASKKPVEATARTAAEPTCTG